jgi:PAS domain S-box-containing protein
MFGFELEELMGQKVNKLLPTPYREQHDAYLQNYHNTGRKRIIGMSRLVEGQHKDGSIFPIRLAVSEVQMGSSKMFIGMIDRVEDTAGTVTANNEGTIISCNKQCEAIWGYSVSELVGKNLCILMPSPHREHHDLYIANYRRTGTMKVINHTRNVPARHKNGTVFPVSLQVTKLKVGVVELFKGRVEKVDTEMEAVFTLDKRGIIVSCNRNFVAPLFGYTDTELIGKHIRVLVPSLTKDSRGQVSIDRSSTTSSSSSSSSSSSTTSTTSTTSTSSTAEEGGDAEASAKRSSNHGSRKRKRSTQGGSGGEGDEEDGIKEDGSGGAATGNGGGASRGEGLESEHSIETQANVLQNEMSAHALRERKGKDRDMEGGSDNDNDNDSSSNNNAGGEAEKEDAAQSKEEPEFSMESSWSLSGRRRLQVRHKDGSVFPVDFSISKFTKDDTGTHHLSLSHTHTEAS